MTRAKHAGPTVKSLKDDYIAVYFTVGGLCPTIKSLATIYPPLFTILYAPTLGGVVVVLRGAQATTTTTSPTPPSSRRRSEDAAAAVGEKEG